MPTAAERTCNWAKGWVTSGIRVTWTNHEPASSLCQWYRANAGSETPPVPPTPSAATMMVCFELPMYAAVLAGAISAKQLLDLYRKHWVDNESWDSLLKGNWIWRTYNPSTHSPTPGTGDIIFFNRLAHVAMSTGNTANPGEIVSVWGLDVTGIAAGTPIELTTIEAIYAVVRMRGARVRRQDEGIGGLSPVGNAAQDVKVEYTAPPW